MKNLENNVCINIFMSTKKIIFYYQTFKSLKPVLIKDTVVTHIHVSSVHFGTNTDGSPYIHLNDNDPDWSGFDTLWQELLEAKQLGIKIVLMVGGAGGAFTDLFSNFEVYYGFLKKLLEEKDIFDGIDLDVEEITPIDNIKKLINRIDADFGKDFIIAMAPVAYSLQRDTPGMSGFVYKDLFKAPEGKRINYFNGQFYYDLTEQTYIDVINNGYPPDKIVFGMESGEDVEAVQTIVANLTNKYNDFGGVYVWEYFSAYENNPYEWAIIMNNAMHKTSKNIIDNVYDIVSYYYNKLLSISPV